MAKYFVIDNLSEAGTRALLDEHLAHTRATSPPDSVHALNLDGIDPGAVLEDVKVGVSHLLRWEKFAVVTDVDWIRHTMKLFSFVLPGQMKVFSRDEATQANEWVVA